LAGDKRTTCRDLFHLATYPKFPRKRISIRSQPPTQRRAQGTPKHGAKARMIFGCFPKLIVQEEELEHALEPFERGAL
jgi:hypothetical protein